MADSKVMDFLQHAAQDIVNPVAKLGNEVGAFGELVNPFGSISGNEQAAQRTLAPNSGLLHQGGVLQGNELNQKGAVFANPGNIEKTVGTGAEIGTTILPGGEFSDLGDVAAKEGFKGVGKKLAMDFLTSSPKNAAIGAGASVASEMANGGGIQPSDILRGATAAVLFGGGSDLFRNLRANFTDKVGSQLLDDATAKKVADSDNPADIQKALEPHVGPAVAQDVSGSLRNVKDPEIVQNVVQNDVRNKLPTQTPLPPQGPTSDINTPQQVTAQAQVQPASAGDIQSLDQSGQQLGPRDLREQPPEPKPFLNAPGKQGPTHVGNLGADTTAYEMLQNGVSVDDVIRQHMEQTNNSFIDSQKAVNNLINNSNLDKGKINMAQNPRYEEGSNIIQHTAAPGDSEDPVKTAQTVHNTVMREGNKALELVDKLNSHDLELMDHLRTTDPETLAKQADNPEQFLAAANATKSANDLTQGIGSGFLGQNVAYRQDYGAPLLLDNSTPEGKAANEAAIAKLKTSPGYSKGRFFKDYDEAENFGAQRQFSNFRDDFAYDMQRRANDLSQLTLSKGLNEAFPGQVKIGQIGSTPEGTYRQLVIPGGNKISMPSEIADKINARAPAPDATGALKGYDTLNAGTKNLKLAGGGFHAINVAGTYIGHQILSGQAFKHPEQIGEMVKSIFSPKTVESTLSDMDRKGYLKAFDQMGLKYGPGETAADVSVEGKLGNIPGLKQIHEAVFNRQIPYMKTRVLQQWMDDHHIDPNNLTREDIQSGTKVAKEINQNYGGINRAIQGLTPRTFKLASRGLLATDYTEGQLRTLVDAFSKGGPEGKMAREVVAGKALLFAGLATAGGLAGGEFKNKNPEEIAKDIIAKTINPSFQFGNYSVSLPETQISEFAKPLVGGITNAKAGKNPLQPVENFATARLAGLPSEAFQLATNKDFYNNPIYGSDYYGRPISAADTVMNLASGVSPVPGSQAIQSAQGNESPAAAVANTIGLNAHPTNSLQYATIQGQTYIRLLKQYNAPQAQIQADTQFFDILESMSKQRTAALKKAETDLANKNTAKAQTDLNDYYKQLSSKLLPWTQSSGSKYMDPTMMTALRSYLPTSATASKYARTDIKNNPTAYGQPLSASSLNNAAQLAAEQQTSNNTQPV